jgi:hypothetical protein
MRVTCNKCGSVGRIGSRKEINQDIADLYCQCLNVHCGHTWVATLAFSHTLNPPASQTKQLILSTIRNLPALEQKELFATLQHGSRH